MGLNKVTGKRYRFGVRNAAGREFLFSEDVARVEQVITHLVQSPMIREQVPEVRYDLAVI